MVSRTKMLNHKKTDNLSDLVCNKRGFFVLYLLERTEQRGAVFLPLLTSLFLIPVGFMWRWGLKNYQSNGS